MSESTPRQSFIPKVSLWNLLTLTALFAIGTAVVLAYRKNRSLLQQRDGLLSLTSRLQVHNDDELVSAEMPRVADDFHSWNVHVPSGKEYELRLGIGAVSKKGIPPILCAVPIAAGRHRVTLHSGDTPDEEFSYIVYVDGKPTMEKSMGTDWISGGWSQASGINWPQEPELSPAPMQLAAQSYLPKLDFGKGNYFNGQSDDFVTRKGYRLWIDERNRAYRPASPIMGFDGDPQYQGIGLRDGLRYKPYTQQPFVWAFTRPSLNTNSPVLRVSAKFFTSDGAIFSSQTQAFQSWVLRNDAEGENAVSWETDPEQSVYSAYLHAQVASDDALQPVVEVKWDADRPDDVGLRLADTPANDQIARWRLCILDGTKHLWRELKIGSRLITPDQAMEIGSANQTGTPLVLDLGTNQLLETRLQWQTNEDLPLQVLERKQTRYAGMGLYDGLPLIQGIQFPATSNPTLSVVVESMLESIADNGSSITLPGGPVFDQIQIELEASRRDWIWLHVKSRN